jgi:hypothetical protein
MKIKGRLALARPAALSGFLRRFGLRGYADARESPVPPARALHFATEEATPSLRSKRRRRLGPAFGAPAALPASKGSGGAPADKAESRRASRNFRAPPRASTLAAAYGRASPAARLSP